MLGVMMLGLRHGFDPDHVAALTDIAGSQPTRLRSLTCSAAYVSGHAAVVIALGVAIAVAGIEVPDAGRIVGATLVAMGAYVLYQAARGRPARSRVHLLQTALQRLRERLRPRVDIEHEHEHTHGSPADHGHRHVAPGDATLVAGGKTPVVTAHRHRHQHVGLAAPYRISTIVAVGAVHGIGAETPTQVLALGAGAWALAPFVFGLVVGNTIVSGIATGALTARRLRLCNAVVALFSIGIGVLALLGTAPVLVW
ncbi:MAG TPA: hypothetical protein VF152_03485 [Acidimicrobiia bacterium]